MISDLTRLGLALRDLRDSLRQDHPEPDPEPDGVVIGWTREGEAMTWPEPSIERAGHALVLASSGAGKTVMVANTLVQSMIRAETRYPPDLRPSTFIADPKGDLVAAVTAGLCCAAPHQLGQTWLLDPFSRPAFPLNLCLGASDNVPADIRAQGLAHLASMVSAGAGAGVHVGTGHRQVEVLTHLFLACLESDHAARNLLWSLDAVSEVEGPELLARVTTSTRAQGFLRSSGSRLGEELRASTASRIRSAFAATGQLERLVTAPSCLDWNVLFGPGQLAMLDLGRPQGGLGSLRTFYANLVARLALDHLRARPSPWAGHHAAVACDEAQILTPVLGDLAEDLLTTGRSRGIALVVLSQGTTLIAEQNAALLRVLVGNTPFKLIGRLDSTDSTLFAKHAAEPRRSGDSLDAARARLTANICNLPDREFYALTPGGRRRFTSAPVDMPAWEVAAERGAGWITWVRNRLALPADQGPRLTLREATPALAQPASMTRGRRRSTPSVRPPAHVEPVHDDPAAAPADRRWRWG